MPALNTTLGNVSPISQNISWDIGTSYPSLQNFNASSSNAEFLDVGIQFIGTAVEWLSFDVAPDESFFSVDFNGYLSFSLVTKNLDQLVNSSYKATINFTFSKLGYISKMRSVDVYLSINGNAGIHTEENTYEVVFNRANNVLSGDTIVNVLNNINSDLLNFWQPTDLFLPKTEFTSEFTIEDNGIAVNPDVPNTGTVNHQCRLMDQSGSVLSAFEINLLVLNDSGIGISPDILEFNLIKDTVEQTLDVSIVNPLDIPFTIEYPSWLVASQISGNTSTIVSFTTTTSLLEAGIYSGVVKVNYNGNYVSIPVNLKIRQFIKIDKGDYHFCLDFSPIQFFPINELAAYVKVIVKVVYNVMGVEEEVNQIYVVPFINEVASLDLGKKVHNLFPRYRKDLFGVNTVEFMKPIDCVIIVEELDANSATFEKQNIYSVVFLPGSKPKMFPLFSNFAFRKINNKNEVFLSYYKDDLVFVDHYTNVSENFIGFSAKTIDLFRFPNPFRSIHIQWENQNLVPEWFTFTGDYSISTDFTHITSLNVLTSLMQKFSTTKIKKLNLNTGFVLQKEIDLIEEMIVSRSVFMQIEGAVYECFNVTPKITLQTSTQNIIERDLEFIIVEK